MGLLRFLLAVSVIISHAGPMFGLTFIPGPIAVQSFFIISGFYMSLVLKQKYNSYWLFISNRLLRLYPTYILLLIFSLVTYTVLSKIYGPEAIPLFRAYRDPNISLSALLTLGTTNLTLLGQEVLLFLGFDMGTGKLYFTRNFWETSPQLWQLAVVPQAWTLSLELTFYFIAPALLKSGIKVILAMIGLSICSRIICYHFLYLTNDPWTYRFFGNELVFFLLGNISYHIYSAIKSRLVPVWISYFLLLILIIATLNYSAGQQNQEIVFQYTSYDIIYLTMIVLSTPFLFHHFKDSTIDRFIGDLSFPLYLSHWYIMTVFWIIPFEFTKNSFSVFLASTALSIAIKLGVDNPINVYRQRRYNKKKELPQKPVLKRVTDLPQKITTSAVNVEP